MDRWTMRILPLLAAAALWACEPLDARAPAEREPSLPTAGAVVDSAMPIDEALRRFHAATPGPVPERLEGGAPSLEALLTDLVRGYAERDAALLERLSVTRAEFGHLYYPESPYPHPPYALQPEFLWYLVEERGARGVQQATERYGGRDVRYVAHACGEAKEEGANRLWGPCMVTVRIGGAGEETVRLANAVVERDGRFKLVGYDNKL